MEMKSIGLGLAKKNCKGQAGGEVLQELFEHYASIFLPRLGSKCPGGEEFRAFFRYQLASYLALKRAYTLALPEGDMVSDLILETYEEFEEDVDESDIPISNEGRVNMLLNIKIQFPCQNDSEMLLEGEGVSF